VELALAGSYVNPTLLGDFPDPGALWDAATGLYWVGTTGGNSEGIFPLHSSVDLVAWKDEGSVFPTSWPSWAGTTCWAPELHITADGNHVVYFVTNSRKSGKLVVGAAISTTGVQGPYKDVLGGPLVETASSDCFGAIDPTFFKDPADGTQYVVWKEDGNSCGQPTPIKAAPVAANGTTFTGPAVQLISNDPSSWEGGITEAPWIMAVGNTYTLFYSGNAYNQPSYAIGVARGASMTTGGWDKNPNNPILRSAPGAGSAGSPLHYGPGHCSVLELHTTAGHYAVVYAAEQPGGSGARNLMLDTVTWGQDGWAVMVTGGGYPSNTSLPIPYET